MLLMMHKFALLTLLSGFLTFLGVARVTATDENSSASSDAAALHSGELLESIRQKYNLPALAGAVFTTNGIVEMAAEGHRKRGASPLVTTNDLWHLGSDTKAMTATLAGTFAAEGKLNWDDEVIPFFPQLQGLVLSEYEGLTVADLLSHKAGFPHDLDWRSLQSKGSLTQQRVEAVRVALSTHPKFKRGEYNYSNVGYVVMGAILEKISGKPWEKLMSERVFTPLEMESAGFGGTGTIGKIDQPWPHTQSGNPTPQNGPLTDNAEVLGPAGTVHCSMTDWVKFLTDQLKGGDGQDSLLTSDIYHEMQTPKPPGDYGFGWLSVNTPWSGGALTHAGSNTMNTCVCWLAPKKGFGVIICTNQGGDQARKACDEAAQELISRFLNEHPNL